MANTRWKDIYTHLKNEGFEVYAPDQKEGLCTSKYIVVKQREVIDTNTVSSVQALYDILLYTPKNNFSIIEEFVEEVKESLDKLFPMIRPAHSETEPFYDNSVEAYMTSILYINYRKMKRR